MERVVSVTNAAGHGGIRGEGRRGRSVGERNGPEHGLEPWAGLEPIPSLVPVFPSVPLLR